MKLDRTKSQRSNLSGAASGGVEDDDVSRPSTGKLQLDHTASDMTAEVGENRKIEHVADTAEHNRGYLSSSTSDAASLATHR